MKIIYLIALIISTVAAIELRKYGGAESYGSPCAENQHSQCSMRLFCTIANPDGTFACGCREHQVWSPLVTACVAKECSNRHTMSYLNSKTNKNNTCTLKLGLWGNTEGFQLQEIQDFMLVCPPWSSFVYNEAGTRAYCKCSQGLAQNSARTECLPKRYHGQSCQAGGEGNVCDTDVVGLVCQNGSCQCGEPGYWNAKESKCYNQAYCRSLQNGDGLFYDAETKQCLGEISVDLLVGAFGRGVRCPANSSPVHKDHPNFLEGLITCECDKSFIKSEDKRECVPAKGFGEACKSALGFLCDKEKKLFCLAETCGCLYNQKWDGYRKICLPGTVG